MQLHGNKEFLNANLRMDGSEDYAEQAVKNSREESTQT